MTREEAKERLPLIQGYAEGKTIQFLKIDGTWRDMTEPNFSSPVNYYRIKPEPKYRPFANAEECIEEMKKHVPFGWVKDKFSFYTIEMIGDSFGKECIKCYGTWFTPEKMFKDATFLDGTPFGVKIEEDKQ